MIKIISIFLVAAWCLTHDTAFLLLAMITLLEAIFDVLQKSSKDANKVSQDVRKAFERFHKKVFSK